MLVSDDQTQPFDAAPAARAAPVTGSGRAPLAAPLPPQALPHLLALRAALGCYRASAAPPNSPAPSRAAAPSSERWSARSTAVPSSSTCAASPTPCPSSASFSLRRRGGRARRMRRNRRRRGARWVCAPPRPRGPPPSTTRRGWCSPAPARRRCGWTRCASRRALRAVAAPASRSCSAASWPRARRRGPVRSGDRYESVRHRCARRTTWRSLGPPTCCAVTRTRAGP